jgi:hypothetical protein
MITDDAELEAAQKVQTVLIALSPSTPSSEAVVSQMRNAAQLAAKAAEHNFSSEAELNNVRAEAGLALIGVIGDLVAGQHVCGWCGVGWSISSARSLCDVKH